MQSLAETLGSLYQQKFDDLAKDYENQLALLDHMTQTYNNAINDAEARGYFVSTRYYAAMQDVERQNIAAMEAEMTELTNAMNEALNSGAIDKYSSAWYEMEEAINSVAEAIQEATTNIAEYEQAMRELEWSYFDYAEEMISAINNEAQFLIDLMSNTNLYEDNGQLTDTGMATMGLYAQSYDIYMKQADDYAAELESINRELANDPNNQNLIARRQELIELQQEAILAAEDEKSAIVDLVEEGIELELSALSDLIDSYEDALDSAKDLYDYQKKIQDQTATIASLQKQLTALSGDTSEENRATVQRIEVSLEEAMSDLEETQYEQYISAQKEMLDDLYDEYEYVLNMRLDDIDALISDMIGIVNDNSSLISSTITESADAVGYTISDELSGTWESTKSVVTTYYEGFNNKWTSTNDMLSAIKTSVDNMVYASTQTAKSTVSSTSRTASSSVSGSSSSSYSSSSSSSSSSGSSSGLSVGKRVKYDSGRYYYSSWGDQPSGQYHQGEYVYVTKIVQNPGPNQNYPIHISTGSTLGNGDLGWIQKSQISGYKQGGLIDYTGLAEVHGSQDNPELVLNAKDTENFIALKDALSEAMSGNSPLANKLNGNVHSNVLKNLAEKSGVGDINPNNGIGTVNNSVDIEIDHVEDYDDFVNQLVKDDQFEKFIRAMTVDRMVGGSRLAKNKYEW